MKNILVTAFSLTLLLSTGLSFGMNVVNDTKKTGDLEVVEDDINSGNDSTASSSGDESEETPNDVDLNLRELMKRIYSPNPKNADQGWMNEVKQDFVRQSTDDKSDDEIDEELDLEAISALQNMPEILEEKKRLKKLIAEKQEKIVLEEENSETKDLDKNESKEDVKEIFIDGFEIEQLDELKQDNPAEEKEIKKEDVVQEEPKNIQREELPECHLPSHQEKNQQEPQQNNKRNQSNRKHNSRSSP